MTRRVRCGIDIYLTLLNVDASAIGVNRCRARCDATLNSRIFIGTVPVVDRILPCDGKLLEELEGDDGLSAECRAEIAPYLPEPETNFEGRLVTLGQQSQDSGARSLYLHGVGEDGRAFVEHDWADARVRVSIDGEEIELSAADLNVELLGDSAERFLSIAMVNDYSGSMMDSDLDDVPPAYAELISFSTRPSATLTPPLVMPFGQACPLSLAPARPLPAVSLPACLPQPTYRS